MKNNSIFILIFIVIVAIYAFDRHLLSLNKNKALEETIKLKDILISEQDSAINVSKRIIFDNAITINRLKNSYDSLDSIKRKIIIKYDEKLVYINDYNSAQLDSIIRSGF